MPTRKATNSQVDPRLPAGAGARFRSELITELRQIDEGFKSQYLLEEIFSKYCDPSTTPASERRTAAIDKWLAAERRNAKTNSRIWEADIYEPEFSFITWLDLVEQVKALISRVLGPVRYPEVIQLGVHTNGASTRIRRSSSAALEKLTGEVHISETAAPHWMLALSGSFVRFDSDVGYTSVRGGPSDQELSLREESVLFTVPKKSDIDRVACKEPEGNMLLQRSVGNYIRRRLKVFGVDLNDQTVNQRLAKEAVARKLATIDLSSASDSITTELVRHLLPDDWFSLLDDLRVKTTLIDGHPHELQMFSSMGNGFTFELESLIFYAVTRVVCRRSGVPGTISVYGDDIIAPSRIVPRLRRVFSFMGFIMNPKKTSYKGPFRESCGRHYYMGFDVTPFYIKREVDTLPDLINHLNHLLEWDGRGWGGFLNRNLYEFWLRWRKLVPKRLWGGLHTSDPTALVTGDSPRLRLVPKVRRGSRPADAARLHWHMVRQHTDLPIGVDPRVEVGWQAMPLISCGERTVWDPGLYLNPGLQNEALESL